MSENVKKGLIIVGIIAAVYVFLFYILPIILKFLGFVFSTLFSVILWVVLGFAILLVIGFVSNKLKK